MSQAERMVEIALDPKATVEAHFPDLIDLYVDATHDSVYSSYDIQGCEEAETATLFHTWINDPGFEGAAFAEIEEKIIGVTMWGKLTQEQLRNPDEYHTTSPELVDTVVSLQVAHKVPTVITMHTTCVSPDFQHQGYGNALRGQALTEIQKKHPEGAFVITQIEKGNVPGVKSSRRLKFVSSGINWPLNPAYEMWYFIIPPQPQAKKAQTSG